MKTSLLLSIFLICIVACKKSEYLKESTHTISQHSGMRMDTLPIDTIMHPYAGRNGCVPKSNFHLAADGTFQTVNIPALGLKGIILDTIFFHVPAGMIWYNPGLFITTEPVVNAWNALLPTGCSPNKYFGIGICDEAPGIITIASKSYYSFFMAGLMCKGKQLHPDTAAYPTTNCKRLE